MVENFGGFRPTDRVSVYRPHDDPTGAPSGEATFIRPTAEDPQYAWVVEYNDEGEVENRYTVHTSDVAENLGQ